MTTNNETEKNVYVQPACKVVQVEIQQMIATSGGTEAYGLEDTDDWFSRQEDMQMKRLFYIAAAAMAVLSACTKEDPIVEVGTGWGLYMVYEQIWE